MATSETLPQAEATAQFAQRLFCELQQAILQHESGALAGEIKAIHDMRVGIRRLRVALNNFAICLRKEDRKRLRVNLEHLARALGGARDLDVMISALKSEQANKSDEDRAAISALIGRLRARRRKRHQQLIGYLQSQDFANFKREIRISGESETAHNSGSEEVRNEQAS
ncbi:MAG: CHAD domain-containing protein [Acidobacteriota bacterium]